MNDLSNEDAKALIQSIANKLSEHFDAVQILVSWPSIQGGTRIMKWGTGNYYARLGMCRDFLVVDNADEIAGAVSREREKE